MTSIKSRLALAGFFIFAAGPSVAEQVSCDQTPGNVAAEYKIGAYLTPQNDYETDVRHLTAVVPLIDQSLQTLFQDHRGPIPDQFQVSFSRACGRDGLVGEGILQAHSESDPRCGRYRVSLYEKNDRDAEKQGDAAADPVYDATHFICAPARWKAATAPSKPKSAQTPPIPVTDYTLSRG